MRQYASLDEMLADFWNGTEPEYLAATIYFSQKHTPQFVWIGRRDLTAIRTAIPSGRTVNDGIMNSVTDPTHLTSATAAFVSGDIGKKVLVTGAGAAGVDLDTTIASISSGTVAVLNSPCLHTVAAAQASIGDTGRAYMSGDQVGVTEGSASNGILSVLTVGEGGVVLTLGTTIGNQGTGYTVTTGLATTDGSGTGLKVDTTAIGETYLQAVEACNLARNNNPDQQWYGFMCCAATDGDHLDLAAWSSANWQVAMYFGSSTDVAIPSGTAGNIALQIKALTDRAFIMFSTTQLGLYPNNIYAAAGPLGEACGLNTGLAGSAFTLNLKQIVNVAPEPLTQTQYNAIVAAYCNVVCSFGPYAGYLVSGILSSGEFFDQILDRAMLINQIQVNLMNLLIAVPKVPQTNPGEHQLIAQVDAACSNMASIGYIAGGVWEGAPVLGLKIGQALPLGFLDQAQPYALQSAGDRAARKAMPIYCAIIEAGAVHSVVVQVNVQL
jgi:hypothetical protein